MQVYYFGYVNACQIGAVFKSAVYIFELWHIHRGYRGIVKRIVFIYCIGEIGFFKLSALKAKIFKLGYTVCNNRFNVSSSEGRVAYFCNRVRHYNTCDILVVKKDFFVYFCRCNSVNAVGNNNIGVTAEIV